MVEEVNNDAPVECAGGVFCYYLILLAAVKRPADAHLAALRALCARSPDMLLRAGQQGQASCALAAQSASHS